ncbi:efflux RND transporter periplasmic adaptor subunit [Amphritea sp.]|uniref:efflux RND transporter periplasmic adaptor subunit n=1 Tax=Amphritea sp. TaxID=1872502 RepID=UPI003D126BFF
MSNIVKGFGLVLLGVVVGAAGLAAVVKTDTFSMGATATVSETSAPASDQPLYWVAPMDPNYRRDKPGKSPMGMDLVPVYKEAGSAADEGPGTIKVSPEVVNNLGVRTAVSAMTQMQFDVRTVGYVDYNQDEIIHVHPRVEGWVEKIYIKAEGDPVVKGEPLYDLYAPALVNAQEEYLFALARGNRDLIRGAETRLRALQVPQQTLDKLKTTGKPSQSVTFFAPQSGVVDNFNIRQGVYVKPGMTLMSIGALDEVWVEAEVFERQASLITAGLPVSIKLDFLPGAAREGVVDYVYPALDAGTRTLKVRMRFNNQDRQLKPNMFAEVIIHKQDTQASLTVPKESVIRGAEANRVVLALGDGRFKSVTVNTGRSDGKQVEILAGLKAGEAVVTSAQFLLDSESSKTSDFMRMHIDQPMEADSAAMSMDGMSMDSMSMDSLSLDSMALDSNSLETPQSDMKEGVNRDSQGQMPESQKPESQDHDGMSPNQETLKQGQVMPLAAEPIALFNRLQSTTARAVL